VCYVLGVLDLKIARVEEAETLQVWLHTASCYHNLVEPITSLDKQQTADNTSKHHPIAHHSWISHHPSSIVQRPSALNHQPSLDPFQSPIPHYPFLYPLSLLGSSSSPTDVQRAFDLVLFSPSPWFFVASRRHRRRRCLSRTI